MAKFIETGDYAASLRQGAATGSATAFSVGIAEKAFIEELLPQVVVTETVRVKVTKMKLSDLFIKEAMDLHLTTSTKKKKRYSI